MIEEEDALRMGISEQWPSRKVLEVLVVCGDGNAIYPLERIIPGASDSNRFAPIGAIQSHLVATCQHSAVAINETLQPKVFSLFLGCDDFPLTHNKVGDSGRTCNNTA